MLKLQSFWFSTSEHCFECTVHRRYLYLCLYYFKGRQAYADYTPIPTHPPPADSSFQPAYTHSHAESYTDNWGVIRLLLLNTYKILISPVTMEW
jgi:hypothetical protein